jgi:hypothetical protein
MRGGLAVVAALAAVSSLALVGASGSPSAAASGVSPAVPPPTGAGLDVSFPQCSPRSHIDFPTNIPFAVVGVNGGIASKSNPCFLREYDFALLLSGQTEQPHASVYVNTGNPALAGTWWPSKDKTQAGTAVENPNGSCSGLAGAPCAYVYGYSMAEADYRRVSESLAPLPGLWWLDVETSNSWQPDVVANAAMLTGMVDYFQAKGLEVGLYSTSYQWNRIAGVTSPDSHLAGLRSWLAGASYSGAAADCEKSPLTPNGVVTMVQYVSVLDADYSCHQLHTAVPTISPAHESVVGSQLTASTGLWGPGDVSYSYQWNRDGTAIPGATSGDYVVAAADAGMYISVTVTGRESGFSTVSETSSGILVLAALMLA